MAKKDLKGQMNMFDFFQPGEEVEMVSLMPQDSDADEMKTIPEQKPEKKEVKKETTEIKEIKEIKENKVKKSKPTNIKPDKMMYHEAVVGGSKVVISYEDYNKVYLLDENKKDFTYSFENTKEAVDFYFDLLKRYKIVTDV